MPSSSNKRLRTGLAAAGIALALLAAPPLRAQDNAAPGIQVGSYQVQSMFDTGYRYSNVVGSQGNYDTFIDLGSGLRLLDSTLEAHAADHPGNLFDNLSLTTMGLGGDPQDVVRLHADRGKLYDFSASFRRDKNVFDYNLLSNPLNPTPNNPATGISQTLHELDLSHRFQDYNLRLLPLAKLSFRLGYSNNVQTGPAETTLHGNVDTELLENYSTTMNSYRFGVDYKPFARTIVSYDQFLEYFKQDTSITGAPTNYQLSNGVPVDIGFVFNGTTPCANPVTNPATNPPTVAATCKGYLSYSRVAPGRSSLPTEHLDLHSNYLKAVEATGAFSYNQGRNTVPGYQELANGLTSVTRGTDTTASALANRVEMSADGSAIWTIFPNLRLIDTFRMNRFENPGDYAFTEATQFSTGPLVNGASTYLLPPAVFNATNCPAPYTALTCPQHTTSSVADLQSGVTYSYLGDNEKHDTLRLVYDFTPTLGAHLGYEYTHLRVADGSSSYTLGDVYDPGPGASLADRGNCALVAKALPAGCSLNADGSVTYTPGAAATAVTPAEAANIHGNTFLMGFVYRPSPKLRLNNDEEFYTADRAFDRIDPLNSQRYSLHGAYEPTPWLQLDGSFQDAQSQNNISGVNELDYTRGYNALAAFHAGDGVNFEFGGAYTDIYSQANICFSLGTSPVPAGVGACPVANSPSPQGALGFYSDLDHYYYANIDYKPSTRVEAHFGYAASYTRGSTLMLNPLTPQGPLQYDYLRPFGSLDLTSTAHLRFHFGYNYYDYRELGTVNIPGLAPIFGDNFHANLVTTSVRYSF